MSDEKEIKQITIDVPCVVNGKNAARGEDVTVTPEDGKFLVGMGRAVRAGTDDAKRIKEEAKAGFYKPGRKAKKAA